ncbi:MAG: hypothetical protein FRX49_06650 [Trebouxia sp. A1-2]|nr:MAG: hypothetical protein FRX49_06650 [Trebouxia sp. A1-2]
MSEEPQGFQMAAHAWLHPLQLSGQRSVVAGPAAVAGPRAMPAGLVVTFVDNDLSAGRNKQNVQQLPFDLLQGLHVTMAQALAVDEQKHSNPQIRGFKGQLKMLANGVSDGLNVTLTSCSQKQDAGCRQLCCAPERLKQLQGSTY